jgi:excisionase family DNA binding protein
MMKLGDYLTVGEAAERLGVSPWTLRYWDRTGKLVPTRHPLSGYRLYRRELLDELLLLAAGAEDVDVPATAASTNAGPQVGRRAPGKPGAKPR